MAKVWAYEKRRGKRQSLAANAAIVRIENGQHIAACLVLDLSAEGARLRLKSLADIPKEFVLLLSNVSKVLRRCEVVWRRENDLGVKFVKASPKPK
jgi:hypothetical protein